MEPLTTPEHNMTRTASAIARALNLTGVVVFAAKTSGPGPALRGWWVSEPAGGWRWLGATVASAVGR